MKKEIGGKTYVEVPEKIKMSCNGCDAQEDKSLCLKLRKTDTFYLCDGIIFKEQTMSKKTALELVDELIAMMGCPPPGQLIKLKSAIELERQQAVDDWAAKSVELVQSEKLREIEKLLSAKRETEMKETIGNLESKVKTHTRTIQEMNDRLKSAITMRPISELPDKVPDGCCLCLVGPHYFHGGFVTGLPKAAVSELATHFYILPMPPALERKLHPCYMPGCGGKASIFVSIDGDGYFVHCDKCEATGPVRVDKKGAEKAWGYE